MRKLKFILYFFMFIIFIIVCIFLNKDKLNYSVIIEEYNENNSHIEYPQIEGLKNKKKQDDINKLLKEQVFLGAKDYLNNPFVNFSNPNYVYDFESGAGFTNHDIASFWYKFDSYGQAHFDNGGIMRDMSKFYCITINMKTGEVIELPDFMIIDKRLIDSTDGESEKPDYNSATQPVFHSFKDAFMIYTSESEKDSFHIFTEQEVIERLTNMERERNWYIDKDKNVVFVFDKNSIKISYTRLKEIIRPQYLDSLS